MDQSLLKIMVKPFKVNISDQIINDIYDKVKKYPWHEMPNDGGSMKF